MNRALKKLNKLLTDQVRSEQNELFEHNGYIYVLYSFVLRYQAIMRDLNLPELKSNIKKYESKDEGSFYPYDDIVHPFFILIDNLNSGSTENYDLRSFFGFPFDVEIVQPESVFKFLNLANKAGVKDWSLSEFSEDEFDVFFKELIKNVSPKKDEWVRSYPEELAKFVDFVLPVNKSVFYLGDDNADLVVQRINKDTASYMTGYPSNILWYYLRPILFGEKKLKLKFRELKALTEIDSDVTVGHIPSGNMDEGFPKEIRSLAKTLEGLYMSILLKKMKENKGMGVFFLPQDFLFQKKKEVYELRKKFIESGILKTVIRFPKGLFTPLSADSFVMIIVDQSIRNKEVQFIDGLDIAVRINPHDNDKIKVFFEQLKNYYYSDSSFFSLGKTVSVKRIIQHNYSLAITNYVNVLEEGQRNLRYGDEELLSFYEIFEPYKLSRTNTDHDSIIIGPSELSDNFEKFKIYNSKLRKARKKSDVYKLESSAFLLTLWDSKFRVGYFEYKGKPIYLQNNVRAFDLKSDENIEYLVLELLSGFVNKQLLKNEVKRTLPLSQNSTIKNIYLRIPSVEQQKQLYSEAIQEVADERLKEIEGLHESIRYIEKEVFSSFAHDFGKLLLKVTSNIDVLSNYLKGLDQREVISLKDSVFFEKIATPGQSVIEVVNRLQSNQAVAQEFLQEEVQFYTSESEKELKEINLNKLIANWVKRQETSNFTILTGDVFSPLEETDNHFRLSYTAKGSKSDILSVLNNMLSNAVEHGFTDTNKQYEFVIYLQQSFSDDGRVHQSTMHIGNNGNPFPKDFTCKDFFTFRHKGPQSTGSGRGGYSIKRRLDNIRATISCESSVLPIDKYPVQFEIQFQYVTL